MSSLACTSCHTAIHGYAYITETDATPTAGKGKPLGLLCQLCWNRLQEADTAGRAEVAN